MRRFVLALFVILVGVSYGVTALAQTKSTVQVLTMASEDSYEQAQALTIALKRAVTRTEGWSLAKGDFSLEVMTAALGCPIPPDVACQKKIADKANINRYVWGTVAKQGKKEVVAVLRLYENGEQKSDTEIKYASNLTDPSDDTLLNIAYDAFAKLTGSAQGVLVVTAGNVSGELFVDGESAGKVVDGRTEITISSGEHKISIKAAGYTEAVGTVTVVAGQSAEITLNPVPLGTGGGGPEDTTPSKSGGFKKTLGYVALGTGAALLIGGGYFWLKSNQTANDDVLEDYATGKLNVKPKEKKGADVCDDARAQDFTPVVEKCDANEKQKSLALVLGISGVVLAGVGGYLVFIDKDKPTEKAAKAKPWPRVRPLVGVGPHGGNVLVDVTF